MKLRMAYRSRARYGFARLLKRYATSRKLEIRRLKGGQYRLEDPGFTTIDIWTSGKYHIVRTSYHQITKKTIVDRDMERGTLPIQKLKIGRFLDKIFYMADAIEERD